MAHPAGDQVADQRSCCKYRRHNAKRHRRIEDFSRIDGQKERLDRSDGQIHRGQEDDHWEQQWFLPDNAQPLGEGVEDSTCDLSCGLRREVAGHAGCDEHGRKQKRRDIEPEYVRRAQTRDEHSGSAGPSNALVVIPPSNNALARSNGISAR